MAQFCTRISTYFSMEQKCIIRNQLLVWQVLINTSLREKSSLCQGSPIVCALLGTRHHSRRWACGASSVFVAAPHCSHYRLSSASCQISGGIIYIILLNHLETTTPDTIYGKIVFPETGPWCPKDQEILPYIILVKIQFILSLVIMRHPAILVF